MKSMIIEDMDLKQIADSGQSFTWREISKGRYAIEAFGQYLEAEQQGNRFTFSCDEEVFERVWKDYFDLERDYGGLKASIDQEDGCLQAAILHGGGIRVLRQDLWEIMVSFLISQNNNISRIRSSIQQICKKYGTCVPMNEEGKAQPVQSLQGQGGSFYYTFPQPDALATATVSDFEALGLGYRAKYLVKLADQMKDGGLAELQNTLDASNDEEARELLKSFYGIGRKVADCICLFGLHRIDMFPIDTHIKKIIEANYANGFPYERYSGALGIVQQYLFYYDLKK